MIDVHCPPIPRSGMWEAWEIPHETRQDARMQAIARGPEDGRSFDRQAIQEAADLLGIIRPVRLRITRGTRKAGAHTIRDGEHYIKLSANFTAESMSGTLWHELTHAAQVDRTEGGWSAFCRQYKMYTRMFGYFRNPYEREARENSATFCDTPLVVIPSVR